MKKILLLIPIVLLAYTTTVAQNFPYFFSVQTAPYSELTNDSPAVDPTMPWDDPSYRAPIGFSFDFLEVTSDSIYNPGAEGPILLFQLLEEYSNDPAYGLVFYGNDLLDRGAAIDVPLSPITYVTEGVEGSRIFKLQYKNAGFYDDVVDTTYTLVSSINIQLWLFEGSNDIEIHFGPSNIVGPFQDPTYNGPFIGIADSLVNSAIRNFWYLQGDPNDPTINNVKTEESLDSIFYTIDQHPADGTVYRFGTSPNVAVRDLQHEDSFRIYPNLVSDITQLEVSNAEWIGDEATIQLIDGQGRVVKHLQQTLEPNQKLDLSPLAPGVYFLTLRTSKYHLTRQLIKQ